MKEIRVGELSGYDIGKRVAITSDGMVVTGPLTDLTWINFKSSHRGVELHSLTVTTGKSTQFKLTSAPLDYLIQIDRG